MSLDLLCAAKLDALTAIAHDSGLETALRLRVAPLQAAFTQLRAANDLSNEGCTKLLDALHQFQRLTFLYHAKATPELIAATDADAQKEKSWSNCPQLAVDPALCEQLAGRLIHSAFQHAPGGEFSNTFQDSPPLDKGKAVLKVSPYARGTAEHIVNYMLRHDVPFDVDFADVLWRKTLVEESTEANVAALAASNAEKFKQVTKHIVVSSRAPAEASVETGKDPGEKKQDIFDDALREFSAKRRTGEVFYTLTYIPTPEDSALDNIPYQDYLKLFFELCNQPWQAIQAANDKLIERLDKAKTLRIVDDDTGTDLTMSVAGKRWVNSTVLKNIPGSEVFASPERESVNGKLVAKGRFQYDNGEIIEDITLVFKDGRVVDFDAAKGRDALAKVIEKDDGKGEGSRFLGEIGIGTNPWLKQHLINGLLVEKISGSVHVALGDAYSYTQYDGKPVVLDNGNRSKGNVHWDITHMLQGPKARIIADEGTLDESIIMRAGQFTDPSLRVLNEGWAAVDNPPEYWRNRLAEKAAERARGMAM